MPEPNAPFRLTIKHDEDQALEQQLRDGLSDHAQDVQHPFDRRHLAIRALDNSGELIGGLTGQFSYHWLYIAFLWVHEDHRRSGVGRALMQRAEQEAIAQNSFGLHLNTLGFQARVFYEKLGFEVLGCLEDDPPEHSRYFMARKIAPHP